tara:strand:- start:284 stop:463 length:180 start_codon:yes stop_codon:yes gene_type:complete
MKDKTSPLAAFSLGIIIILLGVSLPENDNYNYNLIVMILGAIILLISIMMYVKKIKNKK